MGRSGAGKDPSKTGILVLAGDRPGSNPLCDAAGVRAKVLVPVAGQPVILRVLNTVSALFSGPLNGSRLLCGPRPETLNATPELKRVVSDENWHYLKPAQTPASSTAAALKLAEPGETMLVTTADHGFLSAEMIAWFLNQANQSGADAAIALVRYADVMARFPGTRRTAWTFQDDAYCGCNLFAFITPESHRLAAFWRQMEQQRKRPWRMVRTLGATTLLKFISHRLSLAQALTALGQKNDGLDIAPVLLPFPEAAVDVDSIDDWKLVDHTLLSSDKP